jgi:hypothetical protein
MEWWELVEEKPIHLMADRKQRLEKTGDQVYNLHRHVLSDLFPTSRPYLPPLSKMMMPARV